MIAFTEGDMIVVDGKPCLVKGVDDLSVRVLTMHGEYATVHIDDVEAVYID